MALYFAYGSNMSAVQMQERCPGAYSLGAAILPNWRFIITTRRTASIVREPQAQVHGVLWQCTPEHQHSLDRYEGVRIRNYRQRVVSVQSEEGRLRNAIVYVGSNRNKGKSRPDYLLTAVLPGARQHGLPEAYMDELESWLPRQIIGKGFRRYQGRKK